MLLKEALANNLADLNPKAFWSEIKNMNNYKTPLPTSIEGVSGGVQIVEFWRRHFSNFLNCVSNSVHDCEYGCDAPYEELVVSIEEVTHAVEKLDLNKACGSLRILIYWYKNQDMCIRWGDAYSAKFKVTNGVRQGGISSPYLFNV